MAKQTRPDPDQSLADQAYAELSRLILERELAAGSAIVEARIADQLGINRTPIREAILRLAAERMLVKQGSRSFMVRQISVSEYFQSMKARELLECEAVRLAIGKIDAAKTKRLRQDILRLGGETSQIRQHWKADDTLHLMFPDATGNEVLGRLIRSLRISTRLFEIAGPFQRVRADAQEHLDILEAFENNDADGAVAAMLRHLRNLVAYTMDTLRG